MEPSPASGLVRIGELSRRVGVSSHLLRAWEQRYELLDPVRSSGGFRLYSDSDERRVRLMQRHLAGGLSAAEAARAAKADMDVDAHAQPAVTAEPRREPHGSTDLRVLAADWQRALDDFDEPRAHAVLDRLLSDFSLTTTLRDVVLPYLHELGERWERGEVRVAQEHFATNVIRGRLAGLARGWGGAQGPRAILACPPGELHELPLMIFGIVLSRTGWRVEYLGANTPIEELVGAVGRSRPDLVVVAATTTDHFDACETELTRLARVVPLAVAGRGATQALADGVGARVLLGDPVTAAENEVAGR